MMINVDDVLINRLTALCFTQLDDNDIVSLKTEIKRTLTFFNGLSNEREDHSISPDFITTPDKLREDNLRKNRFDFFMNINQHKERYVIV